MNSDSPVSTLEERGLIEEKGRSQFGAILYRTTPLFETGIIDSLGIVDLLAFVETAIGRPVPIRKVDMRYFGTVDRICSSFWADAEGGRP